MIGKKLIHRFLKIASQRLKGRWLLVGGSVIPALGKEYRTTLDIDLVGLGEKERSQTLELMKLAEELKLPVEALNQAAAYFVDKVLKKKDHKNLVLLEEGKNAQIYRPSADLYLQLKIPRFSESDHSDCEEFLRLTQEDVGVAVLQKLKKEVKNATGARRARLEAFQGFLQSGVFKR